MFLVQTLGGFFLAFQLVLLHFGLYLLFLHFCFEKSAIGTLRNLSSTLIILESLCKNTPLKFKTFVATKKIRVQDLNG